jgi:hypothetical protein
MSAPHFKCRIAPGIDIPLRHIAVSRTGSPGAGPSLERGTPGSPSAAWLAPPSHSSSWRLERKSAKKVRDQRKLQAQPTTSAFSPSTHSQTCVLPSHCHHVRRTTVESESRVEGTSLARPGPLTGVLTVCVYRGGVKRCGSTSAPARVSKMFLSRTWAPWAPLKCLLLSCRGCIGRFS